MQLLISSQTKRISKFIYKGKPVSTSPSDTSFVSFFEMKRDANKTINEITILPIVIIIMMMLIMIETFRIISIIEVSKYDEIDSFGLFNSLYIHPDAQAKTKGMT